MLNSKINLQNENDPISTFRADIRVAAKRDGTFQV